jgi:outer membrane cobalamin receptor
VDGGAVLRFPRVTVQMAAFYSRIEDLIVYEQASAGTVKPANVHDAAVRGGEIEARVVPLRGLALEAAYSLALTRNLRDDPRFLGKELTYRPPHRVHARAAFREGDYEAFVAGEHQSSQFVTRANTRSLPGATTFGGGAGVRLTTVPWALWLSAQVDNVFDTHRFDQLAFPQPGRSFTLTLRALSSEEDRRGGYPEKS